MIVLPGGLQKDVFLLPVARTNSVERTVLCQAVKR